MEHGPVDVIIVAGGEPKLDGSILSELIRLAGEGTIRVLDAMVITMEEDGTVNKLDMEELPAELEEALGFVETGTRGMFDSDDFDMLVEAMVPGSAVAAFAIEHAWIVGFTDVMKAAGVEYGMTVHIPDPIVDDALSAVGAQ
jgi:hypothetical protein